MEDQASPRHDFKLENTNAQIFLRANLTFPQSMRANMSQDTLSNRKQKKAQRDNERQKKGKKRKREEDAKDELQKDFIPLGTGLDQVAPDGIDSVPKPRKRKAEHEPDNEAGTTYNAQTPKSKKRKKGSRNNEQHDGSQEQDGVNGAHRFILFIGNLPYTTTDTSLQAHFKKIAPFTLRHRTDPKTKKSKGFAFLEFENYDRMKTCLKLYHHSMFDPAKQGLEVEGEPEKEKKKSKGGRRINVELTAGGGGKSEGRREKIKARNVRLDDQRKRRAELERKEKAKKEEKEKPATDSKATEKQSVAVEEVNAKDDSAAIHPSRLARIKQ